MSEENSISERYLVLKDISVSFGSTAALDNLNLEVYKGEVLALVGPNGAGKTTLLNLMAGLVEPSGGSIKSDIQCSLSYVTQHGRQQNWMPIKVSEVIEMGFYKKNGLFKKLSSDDKATQESVVKKLSLETLLDKQFLDLSGGQKQRVRLAQALVQKADVLLLDEPFTGLDVKNQNMLLDIIRDYKKNGSSVVLTTHNLDVANHCDKIGLVDHSILAYGKAEDVLNTDNLQKAFGGFMITDLQDSTRSHLIVEEHHH